MAQDIEKLLDEIPDLLKKIRGHISQHGDIQRIVESSVKQFDSLTVEKWRDNGDAFDEATGDNGLAYVDRVLEGHPDVYLYGKALTGIRATMEDRFASFRKHSPSTRLRLIVDRKFRKQVQFKEETMTNAAMFLGLLKFKQDLLARYEINDMPSKRKGEN